MRVLLDTHMFLWFLLEDPQLSTTASDVIIDPTNDIEVSPATYWEIAIKIRLGKYTLPEPYGLFIEREIATNDFHRMQWYGEEGHDYAPPPRPSRNYLAAAVCGARCSSQGPGKSPLDRPSPENTLSWRAH